MWTNLIDNAIDAMGGDGTLTVRTRADGERLVVEIGDTGSGVPAEMRSRVFEPFFTTKDIGKGTASDSISPGELLSGATEARSASNRNQHPVRRRASPALTLGRLVPWP